MASTCTNECLSCSDIREIASASDVGFINENFASLKADLDAALAFIKLYLVKDGCSKDTLDANFGCVTNVRDCCDDPTSAMPRESVEAMIRKLIAEQHSCENKKLPRECDYVPQRR